MYFWDVNFGQTLNEIKWVSREKEEIEKQKEKMLGIEKNGLGAAIKAAKEVLKLVPCKGILKY